MVNLNLNSITAKLYRWFYSKDHIEMPDNFCPYFWKVVFMYTFILPFGIFSIPSFILTWIQKDPYGAEGIKEYLGVSIIIYIILGFLTTLSGIFWSDSSGEFFILSIFSWVLIIIFGGKELLTYFKKKYFKPAILSKSKDPNLIVEFIKAKYNKLCPSIKWLKKE